MLPTETGKLTTERRWLRFTPDRLIAGLLVLEGLLLLSEHFRWFAFNQHKGWTVLIAVASVGVAMLLMLVWFVVALIFRCHFQFSIRSLLVLTVAVAILCSWLSWDMKKAREQRQAVEAIGVIEEFGELEGSMTYDWQFDTYGVPIPNAAPPAPDWLRKLLGNDFFNNVVEASLNGDALMEDLKGLSQLHTLGLFSVGITDVGLQHLEGLTQLQELYLNGTDITDVGLRHVEGLTRLQDLGLGGTDITDAGLQHLEGLTQLEVLDLNNTIVTDAGLERLKGMNQLHVLWLNNTQITDAGLEHLKGLSRLQQLHLNTQITDGGLRHLEGLSRLQWLGLDDAQITDAGLQHLEGLTQLQNLDLNGTHITDAGLRHLEGLTQLHELWLSGTEVTDQGVKKLRQALPKCIILR